MSNDIFQIILFGNLQKKKLKLICIEIDKDFLGIYNIYEFNKFLIFLYFDSDNPNLKKVSLNVLLNAELIRQYKIKLIALLIKAIISITSSNFM